MIAIVLLERFIQGLLPPEEETAAVDLDQSAVLTWYVIALHVAHQMHDDETYASQRLRVTLALLSQFVLPILPVDPSQVVMIPLDEDGPSTPPLPPRPTACPGQPDQPPRLSTDDDEGCRNMLAYFIRVLDWRLHVTIDEYVHACEHPDQHMVRRPAVPRMKVHTPCADGARLLLLTPATVAAASH